MRQNDDDDDSKKWRWEGEAYYYYYYYYCFTVIRSKSQFWKILICRYIVSIVYTDVHWTSEKLKEWVKERRKAIGVAFVHEKPESSHPASAKAIPPSFLPPCSLVNLSSPLPPYFIPLNYFVSGYLQRAVNSCRADYTDRFIALVSQSNVRNASIVLVIF